MKPIFFNTEMVRAILDGRKTVTRRVVKGLSDSDGFFIGFATNPEVLAENKKGEEYYKTLNGLYALFNLSDATFPMVKVPYQPGDFLWVKETWANARDFFEADPAVEIPDGYIYRADFNKPAWIDLMKEHLKWRAKWRPSIHMPRKAARIFLRVTDVQVEHLWDITEEQALKEGSQAAPYNADDVSGTPFDLTARDVFPGLWNSTVKPKDRALYGWEENPWVWVISFEQISREEAENNTWDIF